MNVLNFNDYNYIKESNTFDNGNFFDAVNSYKLAGLTVKNPDKITPTFVGIMYSLFKENDMELLTIRSIKSNRKQEGLSFEYSKNGHTYTIDVLDKQLKAKYPGGADYMDYINKHIN